MKFRPFQKIFTSASQCAPPKTGRWAVLEKVHGANFSVYCDGTHVKFAKRTGFLKKEWFYRYQDVAHELAERSMAVWREAGQPEYVILYGELFGGWYPSAAGWRGAVHAGRLTATGKCTVPLTGRAVQEGIYYAPDIRFVTFDIATVQHDAATWLGYERIQKICAKSGLLCLEPLFVGTLQQALAFAPKFDSRVPALCDQAALPPGTNLAEGVVIRPMAESTAMVRPLIKNKHIAFVEVDCEFDPLEARELYLVSAVNHNRLNAIASKHGDLAEMDPDTIVSLVIEDIATDAGERVSAIWSLLDPHVRRLLNNS